MHLIVSLLCLKSFDGSHCFRGLNKKQTLGMNYNVLQRMSILVIPTALTSFHTTPHSKRQPHLSLFGCWNRHVPRPLHLLPSLFLSLLPNSYLLILLISALLSHSKPCTSFILFLMPYSLPCSPRDTQGQGLFFSLIIEAPLLGTVLGILGNYY